MRIFLFLFFVTSLGFSQNTTVNTSVLSLGQSLNFEDRSLIFKRVISDSRCPKGTTCIWAGEAKVLVEVFLKGKFLEEKVISLGEATNPPSDLFGDEFFNISKLKLTPYPEISGKIPLSDYRLLMEVSQTEEI